MTEQFKILSTLRYDPHLARLEEISSVRDSIATVSFSCVDDRFLLESNSTGYKWSHQMLQGQANFETIQERFSLLNNYDVLSTGQGRDGGSTFVDKIFHNVDSLKFFQSRFLFVPQHLNRINMALTYFNSPRDQLTLHEFMTLLIDTIIDKKKTLEDTLIDIKKGNNEQIFKIRVLISQDGCITCEAHPLPTPPFHIYTKGADACSSYFRNVLLGGFNSESTNIWDVFLDTEPILSNTPFTTFKTTRRTHYIVARDRMMEMVSKYRYPSEDKTRCEILVFNENKQFMEGSITNFAIKRLNTRGTSEWITPPLTSGCLCGIFRYFLLEKGYIKEDTVRLDEIKHGDTILIFNGVMGCIKGIIRE